MGTGEEKREDRLCAKVFLKTRQRSRPRKVPRHTEIVHARYPEPIERKGYLDASAVTGKNNASTMKALRIFQMMNGLRATGKANSITVRESS